MDHTEAEWEGGANRIISLRPMPTSDKNEYGGFESEGLRESEACGICHREYTEWLEDAHAQSATNMRFMSIYTGSNIDGDPGQVVQLDFEGNPKPSDPDKPYYGAGFRLDNPNRAGNCATCHTPLASKAPIIENCAWSGCHMDITVERSNGFIAQNADPMSPKAQDGVSCEFCHKISEVYIDPETNVPYPDMPGILSYKLLRPHSEEDEIFFGTVLDVTAKDTYLPLLETSEFCAGCHFGVFGGVVGMQQVTDGTVIYSSYGEWQASPYADPENGQTCQDCHMAISSEDWFVKPEQGGISRDYVQLHNHKMLGITDEEFMQNAVTMKTTATREDGKIDVEVSIINDNTGHHIPTDIPLRSMILVIEVVDADGNVLDQLTGSVNPDYSGDYGGTPGKTFAKVITDEWTGETPTAAFWREVSVAEDTRIPALGTDTTNYSFEAPADGNVTVHVRLLFRRAFYELMQQKGWDDPDLLMEEETIQIPANNG